MEVTDGRIYLPISADEREIACFWPDELPIEYQEIVTILQAVLPPLRIWKRCAVSLLEVTDHSSQIFFNRWSITSKETMKLLIVCLVIFFFL
jgi:hypothetical protein